MAVKEALRCSGRGLPAGSSLVRAPADHWGVTNKAALMCLMHGGSFAGPTSGPGSRETDLRLVRASASVRLVESFINLMLDG
jgi:hypothetical protein